MQSQGRNLTLGVDHVQPGIGAAEGLIHENAHHLTFDGDASDLQMRRKRREGIGIAGLVTPVEDLALEIHQRERAEFEVRHDSGRCAVLRNHDHERALVRHEGLVEEAGEIGSRNQHHGVRTDHGSDVAERRVAICHKTSPKVNGAPRGAPFACRY